MLPNDSIYDFGKKKLLPERAQHHPDGYILTASRMYMTVTSYSYDGSWRSIDEAFTPLLSFYEVNIELKRENEFIYLLKSMKISKEILKFTLKQMYT